MRRRFHPISASLLAAGLFISALPMPASAAYWELTGTVFPSGGNARDLGLRAGLADPASNIGSVAPLPENIFPDSWSMLSDGMLGPVNNASISYRQQASADVMPASPGDGIETGPAPATASLYLNAYLLGYVHQNSQDVYMRNHAFDGDGLAKVSVVQSFRIAADAGESPGGPIAVELGAYFQVGTSPGASGQISGGGNLAGPTDSGQFTIFHNGDAILAHADSATVGHAWGDYLTRSAHVGDTFEVAASVSAWLNAENQDFFGLGAASSGYQPILSVTLSLVPVPEAETWAMWLVGIGLITLAINRHHAGPPRNL